MRKSLLIASILIMGAMTTPVMAGEGKGSIGAGSYAAAVSTSTTKLTYAGLALVGGYEINDYISINGHYYFLSNINFTTEKVDGFDAMIRFGKTGEGFVGFGAIGFYSETLSDSTVTAQQFDFSGTLLGFGIGYNWENVGLVYEASVRSTGDYETFAGTSVTAATGSLNLSYRF